MTDNENKNNVNITIINNIKECLLLEPIRVERCRCDIFARPLNACMFVEILRIKYEIKILHLNFSVNSVSLFVHKFTYIKVSSIDNIF